MEKLNSLNSFRNRHIGPRDYEIPEMLQVIGVNSVDELIEQTIPEDIRLESELKLDAPLSEYKYLEMLREIASKNKIYKSYIGMGYHPTILPAVIQRNILENPGWYTQYTPYQAEISQGRLEALINFQQMIMDLTKMEIANASLLDEGTAAAEAMIMLFNSRKDLKRNSNKFLVSDECFPQTIDVLRTRANPLGIEIKICNINNVEFTDDVFGLIVQYPSDNGEVYDYSELFDRAKSKGINIVISADLLSLALLKPPGEFGADVVVGSNQRFGIPMGYGGPHAGYFATREEFKRMIPGRIIGASIDANGNKAYRMALQTREQHIRREKATSNICTSQVLLAIMSAFYAIYHGQEGIKEIARKIHLSTVNLADALVKLGYEQTNKNFFDTLKIKVDKALSHKIRDIAESKKINFRYFDDGSIGISLNEKTEIEDVEEIISVFIQAKNLKSNISLNDRRSETYRIPEKLLRKSEFLTHHVFNSYHSETELMRYIKSLERKDLSLTSSMIPLGSCTMKLNSASEMLGLSWSEFAELHPFAPTEQAEGYYQIFKELESDLCEITGLDAVSFQPNSGAQGEYTGLMVIRAYHRDNNQSNRNIVLIPASAHGTNPASAVMAGMKVIIVNCDSKGNIDVEDLKNKAEQYSNDLAGLMVTYPSTHGVFEKRIKEICKIIHDNGGQVYMDGANMNAQVGLTSPYLIDADVCHLNLHKTFAIPHGGGGPGMGPIVVKKHLVPYLPAHCVVNTKSEKSITAVASAPWGSASILIISHAYIKMLGFEGLKYASEIAILNANYIKSRLEKYFKVLYTGDKGRVAHELIFDMREFKHSAHIEVEDIAKRLMDYGFHAPTVSFPVPGTLMVEPTESESKQELDRFCDAMISIRNEIKEIEDNVADQIDNVLKNSPHTTEMIVSENWNHKYSREKAVFPTEWTKKNKFWPSVARINNAYGDRNLVCGCEPTSKYK